MSEAIARNSARRVLERGGRDGQRRDELGVPISIHISESRFEMDYSQQHYGATPVKFLDGLGFLNGPTIGAHLVWPTDEDIAILVERAQIGRDERPQLGAKAALAGECPIDVCEQSEIALLE